MPTTKNINDLVINKVESNEVFEYMMAHDLINEDELYLVQGDGSTDVPTDIVIDSEFSSISENPVQNKVITTAINNLNTLVGNTNVSDQISNAISGKADMPKLTNVNILAASWSGDSNPWYQVIDVNGVTANSKIDLQPTAIQIVELQNDDIAFMAENNDGIVTIYAIGDKPTKDYTMQALITEVVVV